MLVIHEEQQATWVPGETSLIVLGLLRIHVLQEYIYKYTHTNILTRLIRMKLFRIQYLLQLQLHK